MEAQGCCIALFCLLLSGCGFLTAPVGLASAELASSSVKAADASLEGSKKAAIFVQDKTVQGYDLSAGALQDLSLYVRQIANWRFSWGAKQEPPSDTLPVSTLVQQSLLPE